MNKFILATLLIALASSQASNFYRLRLNQVNPNQVTDSDIVLTQEGLASLVSNNPKVFFQLQ